MRLIDADALYEALDSKHDKNTYGYALDLGATVTRREILKFIKAFPTIEPEQRWVSVSERCPEEYGNYLVTFENDDVDIGTFYPINDGWTACDADGLYFTDDVDRYDIIAWRCLPEGYRREEE